MFLFPLSSQCSNRRDCWFWSKWAAIHNPKSISICPREEIKRIKKTCFVPDQSVIARAWAVYIITSTFGICNAKNNGNYLFTGQQGFYSVSTISCWDLFFLFCILQDINIMNYSLCHVIYTWQSQNSNDNTSNSKVMWDCWVTGEIQEAFYWHCQVSFVVVFPKTGRQRFPFAGLVSQEADSDRDYWEVP